MTTTPAAPAAQGEFNQRTMSMVRPSLANVESLPALSELVAQAAADAQAAPPPPPRNAAKQWHVRTGAGAQFGPMTAEEVHKWMAEGRLDEATIAWRPGQPDWQPLAQAMGEKAAPAAAPSAPVARDTRIEEAPSAVRTQHDSFLGPAEGGAADSTSVTSRPTVMYQVTKRRWPMVAAATAAAVAVGIGGFLLSKSLRAPTSQEAAVTSDVPTPAAAPAAPSPAPSGAPSDKAEQDAPKDDEGGDDEAQRVETAPKAKKASHHHGRAARRRHRRHNND